MEGCQQCGYPIAQAPDDPLCMNGYCVCSGRRFDYGESFISIHPERMDGKPCVRDMRVTVAMVMGLLSLHSHKSILAAYHYLTEADLVACEGFSKGQEGCTLT